ncbi:MAG: flagellar filament capping protein FliD [Gammaproteobacteria bacterium]|nr:flagellar filament capping protein FliD [Gammaproteobacteria bacterium]
MITATGIGSGLDVSGIVAQLVEAESAPQTFLLDQREARLQAQISGFGTLKSALLELRTSLAGIESVSDFQQRAATSSDDALFTASASSDAVSASYQIKVDELAQSRKLSSQGFGSSVATVGSGQLTFSSGGESFTVDIGATEGSVAEIRDAVNAATGNDIVSATTVQVSDGSGGKETRLLLTALGAQDLTISVADIDGQDTDGTGLSQLVFEAGGTENMQSIQAPKPARVFIDGLLVEGDTNTIEDAIEGVKLELKAADAGATNVLTIADDSSAVKQSLLAFADAYNTYVETVNGLSRFNSPEDAGILVGDSTLRNLQAQIRREFSQRSVQPNLPSNLAEFGITTQDDGALTFDEAMFETQLRNNPQAMSDYFAGEKGLAKRLGTLLDGYLGSNGALDARTTRLDGDIDRIGDARERLDFRVQASERRLLAQFSAMDALVAQLNVTSDFLDQQLNVLSNIVRNDS